MRIILLIPMLILAALQTSPIVAQTKGLTDQMVQRFTVREVSLFDALNKLAAQERIPIGIELKSLDNDGKPVVINLDIQRARLKQVLDLITQQDQSYRWEVIAGTINFTPIEGRDAFLANVLATSIASFRPRGGLNKLQLRNAISELPEVRDLLKVHNVSALNFGSLPSDRIVFPVNVDLNCAATNVRGILNRIIRESNSKLWVVGWDNTRRDTIYINF
jgi:hypothetical protein